MASAAQTKLIERLKEVFQIGDAAELDFGIYRIMHAKADEIQTFLDKLFAGHVKEALAKETGAAQSTTQAELDELLAKLADVGVDPEGHEGVAKLRAKLKQEPDSSALENEVYGHLLTFFERYYDEGDFVSQRRYGSDSYAIPYNGEEVKLYWANHDQYYIKSSETLKNYAFKVDGKRVRFALVAAATEQNNNKAQAGKGRFHIVSEEAAIREDEGELIIPIEYRVVEDAEWKELGENYAEWLEATLPTLDTKAETSKAAKARNDRAAINAAIALNAKGMTLAWRKRLEAAYQKADGSASHWGVLEHHLGRYSAKSSFDYFIHKDLGGFLKRELEFFIKNELMQLGDILADGIEAKQIDQRHFAKLRVLKSIGEKLITFLAQLENFQKKLWLKQKFVLETHYCFTLEQIPSEFYAEIVSNEAQCAEWQQLIGISDAPVDGGDDEQMAFCGAHPFLMLDTKHFDTDFRYRLLSALSDAGKNLDELLGGTCFHGDNFHALRLMQERYREQVQCVYIDPPYNAQSSEIAYRNGFKHSSWASLLFDRLESGRKTLLCDGVQVIAIDEVEQETLGGVLDYVFADWKKVCVPIVHNPRGQQGKNVSYVHEYGYFLYAGDETKRIGDIPRAEIDSRGLRDSGTESDRTDAKNCFYPILVRGAEVVGFGEVPSDSFHPSGSNVKRSDGTTEVWPVNLKGEEKKWRYAVASVGRIRQFLEVKIRKGIAQIIFNKETGVMRSLWVGAKYDASEYGTKLLQSLLGVTEASKFTYPKSIYTVQESLIAAFPNSQAGNVLDYFAGSGTTGHAVLNLNREDGIEEGGITKGQRKYLLAEMGEYFDTVLIPRLKKVVYADKWKDGLPEKSDHEAQQGIRHAFKYLRLESYEDACDNIHLEQTAAQREAFATLPAETQEDYQLKYMLDLEAQGSLLRNADFQKPFDYSLRVIRDDVQTRQAVDLVETFNWLLGLRVESIRQSRGSELKDSSIIEVIGHLGEQQDKRVLIIWRDCEAVSDEMLKAWFLKHRYKATDFEWAKIYVNGENTLENLKQQDDEWAVELIEDAFHRAMFAEAE